MMQAERALLQGKGPAELRQLEVELHEEVFRLLLRRRAGQLPNAVPLHRSRQQLARVKTLLRRQERGSGV